MRTISSELIRAYCEAHYIVLDEGREIHLQVGTVNLELARLMSNKNAHTASVLTAYNPYSEVKTKQENELAQTRLRQRLKEMGIATLDAIGRDAKEQWEPETSVLALDLTLKEAETLADEYGQNAFIWIPKQDALIELCLRYPSAE
jgi:hypothetical protein